MAVVGVLYHHCHLQSTLQAVACRAEVGAILFLVIHVHIIHPLVVAGGAMPPILTVVVPQGVVGVVVVVWLSSVSPCKQLHAVVVLGACCCQWY